MISNCKYSRKRNRQLKNRIKMIFIIEFLLINILLFFCILYQPVTRAAKRRLSTDILEEQPLTPSKTGRPAKMQTITEKSKKKLIVAHKTTF